MSRKLGLYIHIPFCKSKCAYCDFYSGKACEEDYDEYVEQLNKKIEYWSEKADRALTSIYIGGGTPSVLGTDRICGIINHIKNAFLINDNAEVTVEINPESGKSLDFAKLKESGVNRISVGMQSSDEKELKALGRIHSIEDVKLTIGNAKSAGINNISLDLMLGIPYQTKESLKRSIDFCESLGVTHISSYILKIEEGTPFYKNRSSIPFPDEDEQSELYLFAVEYLGSLGYEQYEISNFAKNGFESRHNTSYWTLDEYIGIGPSAHSFLNGRRLYYKRDTQSFYQNITVDDGAGGDEEEFIMLSLRLKSGLDFEKYSKRFGKPVPDRILKTAVKYIKMNLMEFVDNRLFFTPKGFLVSNTIISKLI